MAASFKTKTDAARDAIREAIFEGQLRPGNRLTVVWLAEQLGMSATPVREAVRSLQAAGLITQTPHKTLEVVDLTVADTPDFYLIRATVESLATRLAVPRLTGERRDDLHRRHDAATLAWQADDVPALIELGIAWHFAIYEACEVQHLVDYILRLWVGIRWGPRRDRPDMRHATMSDHDQIMAAIDAGDADTAAATMYTHISSGVAFALDSGCSYC